MPTAWLGLKTISTTSRKYTPQPAPHKSRAHNARQVRRLDFRGGSETGGGCGHGQTAAPRQSCHWYAAVAAQDRGRACRCRSLERVGPPLQCNEHFPDAQKLRRGSNVVAVAQ